MAPEMQKTSVRILEAITPFLIVTIFAAIFGSFFYYIIQPELQKYLPGGPLNIASVQDLLQSRKAYRDDLNGLFTFYKSLTDKAQDPLMMVLPSNSDVPTLYALFEKIAVDVNVGLQVIDISDQGSDAKNTSGIIKSVPISLRFINVDYSTLKRLIDALESNIRLTTIDNFSYDPINHIASFSVKTYYFSGNARN